MSTTYFVSVCCVLFWVQFPEKMKLKTRMHLKCENLRQGCSILQCLNGTRYLKK